MWCNVPQSRTGNQDGIGIYPSEPLDKYLWENMGEPDPWVARGGNGGDPHGEPAAGRQCAERCSCIVAIPCTYPASYSPVMTHDQVEKRTRGHRDSFCPYRVLYVSPPLQEFCE